MTFDNEKNTDQKPEEPKLQNPRVQRLNLARQLAKQSEQHPGLVPGQDKLMSREVVDALGPVIEHQDVSLETVLETLIEELEKADARLDRFSSRLRRLELKRNQRRN
jgi:hypothetical protein